MREGVKRGEERFYSIFEDFEGFGPKSEEGIHFDHDEMRKSRLLRAKFNTMCFNSLQKKNFHGRLFPPHRGLKSLPSKSAPSSFPRSCALLFSSFFCFSILQNTSDIARPSLDRHQPVSPAPALHQVNPSQSHQATASARGSPSVLLILRLLKTSSRRDFCFLGEGGQRSCFRHRVFALFTHSLPQPARS